ncbi:WXG100 family type VII secretion target [Mycobacteroides saopaulense]|uniref:ESAT-6-like protein n=1 Tax=Mycobacteroides saopaulense TaxID=1578165 RepID=A0ABX3BX92_9MYCO|nr:WXG100 family type VII secretion target [Mycobacteroides saopaulense]OHT86537.1 hypothetical protein BKG68_10290 [Mycobacteroides saopaulense]OHU08396.1 hypothetical protein BKG73_14980 [Mycobacteroides saopaulense]
MSKFRVDPAKLGESVTAMEDFHRSVADLRTQAEAVMRRLDKSWDSEAADRGQQFFKQIDTGTEQMGTSLEQLKTFLDNCRQNYQRAIDGNKKMWEVQ